LNRPIKLPAILLFFAAVFVLRGADLTGTWTADVMLDVGSGTATFVFEQKGEILSGTYSGVLGQATAVETDALSRKPRERAKDSTGKRIDDVYARICEVGTVARGDRQTVSGCGRGNEANPSDATGVD
jgi:hypothetical protein